MSVLEETITTALGWPEAGRVQQVPGYRARAELVLGGGTSVWFDDRGALLALINAASHQLTRLEDIARREAERSHPSQQPPPDEVSIVRPYITRHQPVAPVVGLSAAPLAPETAEEAVPDPHSPVARA
ncbi:hypothetical protein [Nonomuraea sediminis]|uniref:hypothetical protein n=1 Tax=Nonomuraea sediminis TaxID=2835864 RepID=UPI001BDDB392|nr:hypothetical protein [Nonomuraea sediminis]